MAQPPNERVTRERLEKARALAKKGQYQKARYMLSELHSNPKAQRLLKQIEGRNDKFQGNISNFFNGVVLTIVGLGIIVVIVAYNVVTNVRGELNRRNEVVNQFSVRGLQGNTELFVDLVYLCFNQVGSTPDSCIDWGEQVYTDFNDEVRLCVIVSESDGIQYRGREEVEILNCLVDSEVPDPRGEAPPAEQ